MKNVFFLLVCFFTFTALQAQPLHINSNVHTGADPAALLIEFMPVDAIVLPNGKVQIGVAPRARVKNLGNKPYTHADNYPLPIVLYQWINGQYVIVKKTGVVVFKPGAVVTLDYYTTYIKGEQLPKFKIEVQAYGGGVTNPDINTDNNNKVGSPE